MIGPSKTTQEVWGWKIDLGGDRRLLIITGPEEPGGQGRRSTRGIEMRLCVGSQELSVPLDSNLALEIGAALVFEAKRRAD